MSRTAPFQRPSGHRGRVSFGRFVGVGLLVSGLLGLAVAAASIEGPGWLDPDGLCAPDLHAHDPSPGFAASYRQSLRLFPPRVTCPGRSGGVHVFQTEQQSWLFGLALLGSVLVLALGLVVLWRRAARELSPRPSGDLLVHVRSVAGVGLAASLACGVLTLASMVLTATMWGPIAAWITCAVVTAPRIAAVDGKHGPGRRRLSTSYERATLTVVVGYSAWAASMHAWGPGGLVPASLLMATGFAVATALLHRLGRPHTVEPA